MTSGELVKNTKWTTVQTSACCTPIEDVAGSVCVGVRPPLKIILFPVHRPGELKSAEWIHFFHISEIIFSSIFHIISIQRKKYIEKKKKFAASRLATIIATRWTGNKFFLRVA